MAARAAGRALRRSGLRPEDVRLILHATAYYQGQDLWPAPSYVQRVAVGNRCTAIEVRQMSNGGMAALELGAAYLGAAPGREGVLLTAADRFCPPGFDRWRSDPGTIYGDGGAALTLSSTGGFARLVSLVSVSDPELEGMHRGDDAFAPAAFTHRCPVDMDRWKRQYVRRAGMGASVLRVSAGHREAVEGALAEAGTGLDGVDWFVVPHFGLRRLRSGYFTPFGIDPDRTTWSWARGVGHLGAADQFAGLDHLVSAGRAGPGQRLLLMGVGAGFTWSCAVVEIVDRPRWS
ncbi:MAG: 3-oxoacyl-ACP synthase [Nonomuraea sp.]|nr:3-oxoacyl-ACP synthase [Nonomuraea sp.]